MSHEIQYRFLSLIVLLIGVGLTNLNAETGPTLILGAVPWEMAPVIDAMDDPQEGQLHNIPYWKGMLYGESVVVALTGVSKTNTGMVAGAMITEFDPVRVVWSGTGARVRSEIKPGYVFIIEMTTFHDTGDLTEEGMVVGPVIGPPDGLLRKPVFHPDPELLSVALKAAETYIPAAPIEVDGERYDTVVEAGSIVTGDLFSINQWKYEEIVNKFKTDLFAMETASLGQVCTFMDKPWIAMRGGSDLIQAGDATEDYLKYGPIAAEQAALFTLHFLSVLFGE